MFQCVVVSGTAVRFGNLAIPTRGISSARGNVLIRRQSLHVKSDVSTSLERISTNCEPSSACRWKRPVD
jgi:hypothetical protein